MRRSTARQCQILQSLWLQSRHGHATTIGLIACRICASDGRFTCAPCERYAGLHHMPRLRRFVQGRCRVLQQMRLPIRGSHGL